MTRSDTLHIRLCKEKWLGAFTLSIKNNFELPYKAITKGFPEDGMINTDVAYDLEKIIQELIALAKDKLQTKALNWKIVFNQESSIREEFGARARVYKISEEEIDTVFDTIRIMNR